MAAAHPDRVRAAFSCVGKFHMGVAQRVERRSPKPHVVGSSPAAHAIREDPEHVPCQLHSGQHEGPGRHAGGTTGRAGRDLGSASRQAAALWTQRARFESSPESMGCVLVHSLALQA